MSEKCFICGRDTDDQLARGPMPKELLVNQEETFLPVCMRCNDVRRNIDGTFIQLCMDTKMLEWFRSNSKKHSEYYPPTLIYNIPVERLRLLYKHIVEIAEEADNISNDVDKRKLIEDELNYEWRKKDE